MIKALSVTDLLPGKIEEGSVILVRDESDVEFFEQLIKKHTSKKRWDLDNKKWHEATLRTK